MKSRTLLLFLLLLATSGRAALYEIHPQSPTDEVWQNQPLGTWTIRSVTSPKREGAPQRTTYERELLIGSDDRGKPWFEVFTAPSPDGPWDKPFGHGGGTFWFDEACAKREALPDEVLSISGQSFPCHVFHYSVTDDFGTTNGDRWIDARTGIELKYVFDKSLAGKAGGKTHDELATVAFRSEKFDGKDVQTFLQQSTSQINGKTTSRGENVVSPNIPGQRLESRRWIGSDITKAPDFESKLISVGVSAELLADYRKRHPDPAVAQKLAEEKRVHDVRAFHESVLAEVNSPSPATRQNAAMLLQDLRGWDPDEVAIATEAIARLLNDTEPEVRRLAAIAAASHHSPAQARESFC